MNNATQDLVHGDGTHRMPIGRAAGVSILARMARILQQWHERARQRRQLSFLTPRELEDLGISAEAAGIEAAKPFWWP